MLKLPDSIRLERVRGRRWRTTCDVVKETAKDNDSLDDFFFCKLFAHIFVTIIWSNDISVVKKKKKKKTSLYCFRIFRTPRSIIELRKDNGLEKKVVFIERRLCKIDTENETVTKLVETA